jgi:hypothetical protein
VDSINWDNTHIHGQKARKWPAYITKTSDSVGSDTTDYVGETRGTIRTVQQIE